MDQTIYFVLFIAVFGSIIVILFHLINSQFKSKQKAGFKLPRKTDLVGIYKNITIKPYGCFSNLDKKFFQKKINYAKNGSLDSGILISDTDQDRSIQDLIDHVIRIGFDQYGYSLINRFNGNYSGISIKEIGILAKLAGYNYLSIYKLDEKTRGKIYLTYSPPLNRQIDYNASKEEYDKSLTISDLKNYTLTPKLDNYTNEKAPGKELSCGYTCLTEGKPLIYDDNGTKRHYMCGSVAYPEIKTPARFAVYQLV
jgi:hypothetical protein